MLAAAVRGAIPAALLEPARLTSDGHAPICLEGCTCVGGVGRLRVDGDTEDWVFDERFVRSGVHEPPARTRAAIAQFGGQQTSWRQTGVPVGAERRPRRAGSIEERLGRHRGSGVRSRRGRIGCWLIAALSGILALGAVLQWTGHGPGPAGRLIDSGTAGAGRVIGTSSIQPSTTPDTQNQLVHGISPTTPIGACFTSSRANPNPNQPLILNQVECNSAHYFQLVSIDRAQGSSLSYPDDNYWQISVEQGCEADVVAYTHRPVAATVSGNVAMMFFRPTRSSWSFGDRTIYCVAYSAHPMVASLDG